jgi:hypothetical protein
MGDLLNSVNDIVGQSSDQGSGLSQDLSQNIALANQQPGTSGGAPVGGFWQNFGQTLALPAKDILLGAKQHVLDPLTNAVNNALPDWVQAKLTEANKNLGLAATPEEAQKNTNKLIEDTRKYYADVLKTPGGQAGYATGTIGTALAGGTTLKLAGLPELGAAGFGRFATYCWR